MGWSGTSTHLKNGSKHKKRIIKKFIDENKEFSRVNLNSLLQNNDKYLRVYLGEDTNESLYDNPFTYEIGFFVEYDTEMLYKLLFGRKIGVAECKINMDYDTMKIIRTSWRR